MDKYVDATGEDFTEWMTSQEQIDLFERMVAAQERSKRPLKECYLDVIEAVNLDAQIKGKPKRAFFQADPRLN
jgi:hypothetical protein